MAINVLDSDASFFGDGTSVTFTFDFKVFSEDEIRVVKKDTLTDTFTELTLTTDYAVTLNEGEGGFVLFSAAPLVTDEIYLFRNTDKTQQVELDGDYVNPKQLENALDISRAIDQELDRGLKKAIKLPETSTLEGLEVIDPTFNKYLKWDNQRNIISSDIDYSEILNTPTIPPPAPVDSVAGKTGVVVLNKSDVGLGSVDNTSDLNKPTSTATQTLIDNLNTRIDDLELVDLADVDASGFTQIAVVTYNPVTGKFEAGASGGGGAVDSVNGQIGVVVLDADDIDDTSTTHKFATQAQLDAVDGLGALASLNEVSNNDLENMNANTVKGRLSGNGVPQDIAMSNLPISTATQNALDLKADQTALTSGLAGKEDSLGNPASNGQVLASQTDGTRSWIDVQTDPIAITPFTDTGDGVETDFTLPVTPPSKFATHVSVGNVYQEKSSYSLTGDVISFNTAPENGKSIEILSITNIADIGVPSDDTVSTAKIQDGAKNELAPIGSVNAFAGASAPSKWLICDGSEISRTTYADLFSVLSTTYGSGDGSTTFNLPDLRGEFIRGLDGGRGVDSGRTLGSFQDHELESHRHAVPNMRLVTGGDYAHLRWTEGSSSQIKNTNFTGGSETRPRNIAMNYIIKAEY